MYDNLRCPHCCSDFTMQIDYDFDNHSEKRFCTDCGNDYIFWKRASHSCKRFTQQSAGRILCAWTLQKI